MWQAEQDLAARIGCVEATSTSITTVASTQEYSLPTNCLYVTRVNYKTWSKLKKIDKTQMEWLDGFNGTQQTSGMPDSYYLYNGKIGIYPTPTGTETLTIEYVPQPAEITSGSSAFTIHQLLHLPIIDFCLYRIWGKDQQNDRATFHINLYEKGVSEGYRKWAKYKASDRTNVVKDEFMYVHTDLGMS
jgi:hypothetical protein